jgi:hypothetical protein
MLRKFPAALVIAVAYASMATAQVTRTADIAVVNKAEADNAAVADTRVAAEEAWYDKHELSLTSDGTIPGNLRVFDENGSLVPARVKLFFLREGQVVSQTLPNEQGDFQISGLQPGIYSVVAAGQSGFAAMGVRILPPPNRPEAPKANTIGKVREVSQPLGLQFRMNMPLIQPVDVRTAFQLASQQNAGGLGSFPMGSGSPLGGGGLGGGGLGGGGGVGGGLGMGGGLTSGLLGAMVAGGVAGAVSSSSSDSGESSPNGSGS